jgi:hypothetical protein
MMLAVDSQVQKSKFTMGQMSGSGSGLVSRIQIDIESLSELNC